MNTATARIIESALCINVWSNTPYRCKLGTVGQGEFLKCVWMGAYEVISPKCRIYASVNSVSIGSCNGLSAVQRQAITWTNTAKMSISPSRTNFIEIWIEIKKNFSFMKRRLKRSSAKWRPFCPGRNELNARCIGSSLQNTSSTTCICSWCITEMK